MPPSQRAKQFLPFDAVAGLRQALRMKEHEMGLITRKELSEESAEEINEALQRLKRGDRISVAYFKNEEGLASTYGADSGSPFRDEEDFDRGEGDMVCITGTVTDMDTMARTVTVEEDGAETDCHGFTEENVIKISDIVSIDLFDSEV